MPLVCPIFTLKPWDQQYPVLSQGGFTVTQWDGRPGGVSPVGWPGEAKAGVRRLGGHHRGECALDVLDGLGECGVCCDEVVDGGILLDGRICKVVE